MTLAALILIDDERPAAPVLGLAWPEFQMRRAVKAGARHIVLVAGRVTRDVVEAIDRLRDEGLSATLARSASEVTDLFHPEEAVLLMTGVTVTSDAVLRDLLGATASTVLCVATDTAGQSHELIDAAHSWSGYARIDGAQVRATASVSGEWDLGSVLLRRAVAARATRMLLADKERLGEANVADAVATGRRLVDAAATVAPGWGEAGLLQPVARALARLTPAILPSVARLGHWIVLIALVCAPVAASARINPLGIALFVAALLGAVFTRIASTTTGIPPAAVRFFAPVRDGSAVLALTLVAAQSAMIVAAAVLVVVVTALVALSDRLLTAGPGPRPPWLADRAGHATLLLAGALAGQHGIIFALSLCALHGFATLAWLQDRLSRVLTSRL